MPFTPMFDHPAEKRDKDIHTIYLTILTRDKLNLRPDYQRGACWSNEQKAYLIDTIMNKIPLHNFLLYHHEADYECLDGQNRLLTFKEYIEQTPNDDMFFWEINNVDGSQERVYYVQSDEIASYCEKKLAEKKAKKGSVSKQISYRPMTQEEKHHFDRFELTILTIRNKLTLEMRQDIFRRYQNGTAISGCDKFLNDISHPMFCQYVLHMKLKESHVKPLSDMLKSGSNNWLWDLYRMALVFMKHEPDNKINYSLISSKAARNNIHKPRGAYLFKEDDYARSLDILTEFLTKFSYLKNENLYLSLLVSIAYLWFNAAPALKSRLENMETTLPRVKALLVNSQLKKNTLNNDPTAKDALEAFPTIKEAMESFSPVPEPQKVGKATRQQVWNKYIGADKGTAKCLCCDLTEMQQISPSWESGHVEARKGPKKGEDTIANLRPICQPCNREMGTQNMRDYMIAHGYATARAFP